MEYILPCYRTGNGQTLVLLHGQISSHRYWWQVAPYLQSHFTVAALDLLGFGDAPKPKAHLYDVDSHVDAVYATLQAQKLKTPVVMAGHSMGAQIAIRFAVRYPELVDRLVLTALPRLPRGREKQFLLKEFPMLRWSMVAPLARVLLWAHTHYQRPTRWAAYKIGLRYFPTYPREILEDTVRHSFVAFERSFRHVVVGYDHFEDLEKLELPIAVVQGTKDSIAKPATKRLYAMKLTNIHVVELPTEHNLPIEAPQEYAHIILNGADDTTTSQPPEV